MSRRDRTGGPAKGHIAPSGQLWQVPEYPRPQVVLHETQVTIDGRFHPVRPGQEPREAATQVLVDLALRLRGEAGAVRADVRTLGSEQAWKAIVTATGEVFDATTTAKGGGGRRRNGRLLLAGGGVLVAVLAFGTALVVVLAQQQPATPAVAATGPAPTGTPAPYPQLPPPGFSGRADWSAAIGGQSEPVITTAGQVVTVSPTTTDRTLDVRDPRTGIPVWSAALPSGMGTGGQGLRLSVLDGQESVVATTPSSLAWWPVEGPDHTPRTVALPTGATVSYAGSTPLVTWPGQHAGLITHGTLTDAAAPAGSVAVGATDSTIVATNSVGQLWRLTAATATSLPAPIATAQRVAGATALESVAGYAAPHPASTTPELLVLTWYTADPATRVVSLLDATTGAAVGASVTVARSAVTSSGWRASEHNTIGTLGQVLVDVTAPAVHTLPDGWATTAITETHVYGTSNTTTLVADATGATTPTGSGVIPLGTADGLAVVTATVGYDTTVYGLPPATTPAGPTPSVKVPAPPALRPTNPVPGPAPTPASSPAGTR